MYCIRNQNKQVPADTEAPLFLAVILVISALALPADLNLSNCIFFLIYVHSGVIAPILYPLDRITPHLAFFLFHSFPIASKFRLRFHLFYILKFTVAFPQSSAPQIFSCLCHKNPLSNKGRTTYYSGLFNTFSSPYFSSFHNFFLFPTQSEMSPDIFQISHS